MTPEEVSIGIVALNDGRLVGRTRLQKSAFLLERLGMNSGLEFEYRYYGPYSADLARGWDEAEFDNHLQMSEYPGSKEMPYTIFTTKAKAPEKLGDLSAKRVQRLLGEMGKVSDVVLEIAATIVYLHSSVNDPIEEVKILKPHKATEKRIEAAQNLITRLGFPG